jgi:hypothetical protein
MLKHVDGQHGTALEQEVSVLMQSHIPAEPLHWVMCCTCLRLPASQHTLQIAAPPPHCLTCPPSPHLSLVTGHPHRDHVVCVNLMEGDTLWKLGGHLSGGVEEATCTHIKVRCSPVSG